MTVSCALGEFRQYLRMRRLGEVEKPRPPRVEAVREEVSVGGHLGFGMMRMRPDGAGGKRGDDTSILCRCRISVDHRKKVTFLLGGVASPDEEIVAVGRSRCRATRGEGDERCDTAEKLEPDVEGIVHSFA